LCVLIFHTFFLYNKINGNDDYDDEDDDDVSVIFEQTVFFPSSLIFGAFLLLSDQTQLNPDNSSFNPRLSMTVWNNEYFKKYVHQGEEFVWWYQGTCLMRLELSIMYYEKTDYK